MQSETDKSRQPARFTDGKSAGSVDVGVSLEDRGVAIEFADGRERLIWPYGALGSSEPIGRHAVDALLTYSYQPGATLFVADAAFARALAKRAPQLTSSAQRWRAARPLIWATVGIVVISAAVWASGLSPARTIAGFLPDSARQTLGRQVLDSMTSGRRQCDDPKGVAAVERLRDRLSAGAGGKSFKVVVVDWDLFNAFATPGEQIVLTRGLIEKAKGPDELAGVLAHEMGHGIELHPESGLVRAIGLAAAVELMLGGSGGTLANVGLYLAQMSYSRDAEREADVRALELLKTAEVSPYGLLAFFERVLEIEGKEPGEKGSKIANVFASHPLTEERKAMVEAVKPYSSRPSLEEADWQALRMICGSGTGDGAGGQQGSVPAREL
ncbi:MAG: M48 family metallopeptidase [Hyphomicrobium sp.]|nr:M48 family metallopeptidase [Hyphomicrobium sp.]